MFRLVIEARAGVQAASGSETEIEANKNLGDGKNVGKRGGRLEGADAGLDIPAVVCSFGTGDSVIAGCAGNAREAYNGSSGTLDEGELLGNCFFIWSGEKTCAKRRAKLTST